MFYLVIYHHKHDGDFDKEHLSCEDAGKLLMHALTVQPNESDPQETTEWHLSNAAPDDIDSWDEVRKL